MSSGRIARESKLAPAAGRQRLRNLVYQSRLFAAPSGPVPERLRLVPTDPWPGNATVGGFILDGEFIIAGIRLAQGESPWQAALSSERQVRLLHGFDWLADLRAVGSDAARARARELVLSWCENCGRWAPISWRPDVLGARLANWMAGFGFFSVGADVSFHQTFLASLAAQTGHLLRAANDPPEDGRRFDAIRAMIYAGVCLAGHEAALNTGLAILERECARQILADGGHIERNPSRQLRVLARLIDIRGVLMSGRLEVPETVQGAIDRMTPMLRGYRLGDGKLARFNGGGDDDAALVGAVIALAAHRGRAIASAPHTGYQRLAAGRTVLLADTGGPPPAPFARTAHAGMLSFEMTVGRHPLVVNCGTDGAGDAAWMRAMRATAAHSGLAVGDSNSLVFAADGAADGVIAGAPLTVTVVRREADGNIWIEASHDGYGRTFGLLHQRRLFLAADGGDLRGEDVLSAVGGPGGKGKGKGKAFTVRFHLHPRVSASLVADGGAVLLRPPGPKGWRFVATGGRLALEESVYLGDAGHRRRCEQITITGTTEERITTVKWALRQDGG